MRTTTRKADITARFLTVSVMFALLLGCAVGVLHVGAAEQLPSEPTLAATYDVGETITPGNIGIQEGGQTYAVSPVVYLPDGTADARKDVTLTYPGTYTVSYRKTVGNTLLAKDFTFEAQLPTYSAAHGSQVSFGMREKTYKSRYILDGDWGAFGDESNTDTYTASVEGLHMQLTAGDTFTYNKVIDLNDLHRTGTPVLTFGILPDDGARDAQYIYFHLTDAHDPNNVMNIQCSTQYNDVSIQKNVDWWMYYTYIEARTNSQVFTGIENGVKHTMPNPYGSQAKMGLFGNRSGRYVDKEYISFYYDPDEKALYQQSLYGMHIVCDFDNPEHFSTFFDGFTTDEVILSVSASGYYTPALNLYLTSVGHDGKEQFSEKYLNEFPAPMLTVDSANAPDNALVGYPYTLPTASARQAYSGAITPQANVYFAYGSSTQTDVSVTDGTFTPTREGKYTVVYSASSVTGETATETFEVWAKAADYAAITLTDLPALTAVVGQKVTIPSPTVTGGVGTVAIDVTLQCGNRYYTPQNGVFVPTHSGDYEIMYTATDVFGRTCTARGALTVAYGDAPVIDEDAIVLPHYFIKGQTYTLPTVYAYRYAGDGGVTRSIAGVYATLGTLQGNRYTPETAGEAQVAYTAAYNGSSSVQTRTVPVLDVSGTQEGTLDISKYFVRTGISAESFDEYIAFTGQQVDNGMTFANLFIADEFNMRLSVPSSVAVDAVTEITLGDGYGNGAITLTLAKTSEGIALSYGGKVRHVYAAGETFDIMYRKRNGGVYVTASKFFIPEDFDGFASGLLSFGVSFLGNGSGALRVHMLNGQPINNATADAVRPNVTSTQFYDFSRNFGDVIAVYPALTEDALSAVTSATVTVRKPGSRDFATASDGTVLDNAPADKTYYVSADSYGYLSIRYDVSAGGRQNNVSYSVEIADTERPTLTVNGSLPSSVKIGESVSLPTYTVSDNYSESNEIAVRCFVRNLDNYRYEQVTAGETYTFRQAGKYAVRYTAVDGAGNVTNVEFTVTVA